MILNLAIYMEDPKLCSGDEIIVEGYVSEVDNLTEQKLNIVKGEPSYLDDDEPNFEFIGEYIESVTYCKLDRMAECRWELLTVPVYWNLKSNRSIINDFVTALKEVFSKKNRERLNLIEFRDKYNKRRGM